MPHRMVFLDIGGVELLESVVVLGWRLPRPNVLVVRLPELVVAFVVKLLRPVRLAAWPLEPVVVLAVGLLVSVVLAV